MRSLASLASLSALATLATLATAALGPDAAACPAPPDGDPSYRCSKYDRMLDRTVDAPIAADPVAVPALAYIRVAPARLPDAPTHEQLAGLVAGSRWVPVLDLEDGAGPIRIFDGAAVPEVLPRRRGVRNVIARSIDEAALQVYLDATPYTVQRCRDARHRRTVCLVRS